MKLAVCLLAVVLVLAVSTLHVPKQQVPLYYDSLGYAAQAQSLADGHGNSILIGGEAFPGFYPAGFPALAAAVLEAGAADVRAGIHAVYACGLLAVVVVFVLGARLAGPWAGATAALLLLSSELFRYSAVNLHSQVPSTLALALCAWAFTSARGATGGFALALGALAAGLLRYANLAWAVGVLLAETAFGLRTESAGRARPRLAALAAGAVAGIGLILAHNVWANGGPLRTGYDVWGQGIADFSFSFSYVFDPPMYVTAEEGREWGWPLLETFVGLGRLYPVPVFLAALAGAVWLWRSNERRARLAVVFAVAVLAAQYLVLACYFFRADTHLVPTLALVTVLAGVGACGWLAERWRPVAALVAAAMLVVQVDGGVPLSAREVQAVERYDALAAAAAAAEPDAVLITAGDPALVEGLFQTPERRVLYLGPFDTPALEELARRELDGAEFTVENVLAYAAARMAEDRPVYLDTFGPARTVLDYHREVNRALRRTFVKHETGIPNLVRLVRG